MVIKELNKIETGISLLYIHIYTQQYTISIYIVHVENLTTPMRSPLPYSPVSSFFPSSFMMTERRRPLSTIKVLSDLSPCLREKKREKG